MTCAINGCSNKAVYRGVCSAHRRIRENSRNKSDHDRFWDKVDKTDTCWLWLGTKNDKGYGQVFLSGRRRRYAHRYSYEIHVGPIPAGAVLDHRCHVRHCVNPAHLRPVTPTQNQEHRKGAESISKTGIRGVYPAPSGRWVVQARHVHIGTFDTLEEAEEQAREARLRLMTHSDVDRRSRCLTATDT